MGVKIAERNIITFLCAAVIVMCSAGFVYAESVQYEDLADSYEDKTVILSSNDVHGAIDGYQYIAGLRDELNRRGADVYLVDAGDYSQGDINVAWDKGMSAVNMMNAAGYSVATLGNHEFDYGREQLLSSVDKANFSIICGNVIDKETKKTLLKNTETIKNGELLIGFIGLETPETMDNSLPGILDGLTFLDDTTDPKIFEKAAEDVRSLKDDGADVVIALSHLGTLERSIPCRSYDLWDAFNKDPEKNDLDLIIDGHSHTVLTEGEHGEPIMSTGTRFENVGVTVIDEKKEKIEKRFLYKIDDVKAKEWSNASVKAEADRILEEVDEYYSVKIGRSEYELNGQVSKKEAAEQGLVYPNGNRDGETNTGDLAADALRAMALRAYEEGVSYDVDSDHIIGIMNGGAIKNGIPKGEITKRDVYNCTPYRNTICGVYMKGSVLLEAMEASTQTMPNQINAFPQVSGMEYTIYTGRNYYPLDDPYPGSVWHGPKEIRRVKITSINGKPFKKDDKYLVMMNSFCAGGGDTYYLFGQTEDQFDTGVITADALIAYIEGDLGGVIGEEYADLTGSGRIKVSTDSQEKSANPMKVKVTNKTVKYKKVKKYAVTVKPFKVSRAVGKVAYKKTGGSKRLTLNKKTGTVTVKRGTKKGTYKITVKVTAAGDDDYKAKSKTVTAKVRVK